MEYLGYIAASNPLPNHYPRRSLPPSRAKSTTAVPPALRSRLAGHRKTNSSDSVTSREAAGAAASPAQPEAAREAAEEDGQKDDQNDEAAQSAAAAAAASPRLAHHQHSLPSPPVHSWSDSLHGRRAATRDQQPLFPQPPHQESLGSAARRTPSREPLAEPPGSPLADPARTTASPTKGPLDRTPHATPRLLSPHHADTATCAMFPDRYLHNIPVPPSNPNPNLLSTMAARSPSTGAAPTSHPGGASTASFARSESTASTLAANTTLNPSLNSSKTTMVSSEPSSSAEGHAARSSSQSLLAAPNQGRKPFVVRNGRTYLSDPSLSYPLPVDLPELHRQSLRTLVFFQLFGGPVCSPAFDHKPPTSVLEVGCGSAFWSRMCNQYYTRQGHRGISFTGMDIAPVGSGASSVAGKNRSRYSSASLSSSTSSTGRAGRGRGNNRDSKDSRYSRDATDDNDAKRASKDGKDGSSNSMNWRFVQHDLRRFPWPFANDEFDLVMVKDMSMTIRTESYQMVIEECIRILQPNGTLELWDSDHAIRILRPHVPEPSPADDDEEDEHDAAISAGAYLMTPSTPLSATQNPYIAEFNTWITKALQSRSLSFVPCSLAKAMFYQEADALTGAGSRRLAIPLSEVKWEREGVGGVVTKDGKTYVETKGKGRDTDQTKRTITRAQNALRHTTLTTFVQMIQSLEPVLREVSGKSQDEWDSWYGKMMNDIMKENGTHWGECLEVGAWWAQKR